MISSHLLLPLKRASHSTFRCLQLEKLEMQSKIVKDYQGAVEVLNSVQSNRQYLNSPHAQPKAHSNIVELTKFLKRSGLSLEDLDKLSVIHITGTNGKGSTSAYCENILRNHGYTTGFYSSPHLLDVRERIRINGKPISKKEFAKFFWNIYDTLDSQREYPEDIPFYFRYLTLMAFHVFLAHKVDVAILEVGIGGEYDCTNIVRNTIVAGVTPLDLDHTSILGDSLEAIAWNKSGIFKRGCVAFSVKQPDSVLEVFRKRSIERGCTFNVIADHYRSSNNLKVPSHIQSTNASLALAITETFMKKTNGNFSTDLASKSISETSWPGRYEIRQYQNVRFFLDGAHTLDSISVCREWFEEKTKGGAARKALVFNLTGKRDPRNFFVELGKCEFDVVMFVPNVGCEKRDRADVADFILTEDKQLLLCEDYKEQWLRMKPSKVSVFPSFSKAAEYLVNNGGFNCLVTGSIHLIGAALSVIDPTLNGTLTD